MNDSKASIDQEEFLMKETVIRIKRIGKGVLKYLPFLFVATSLGAIYGIYNYKNKQINYTSELSFTINKEEGRSSSGINNILGSFGFGQSGAGEMNISRLQEMVKSNQISFAALLDSAMINNHSDLLANHVISRYDIAKLRRTLQDEEGLISRISSSKLDELDDEETLSLKGLKSFIIDGTKTPALIQTEWDDDSKVLTFASNTTDEFLSNALIKSFYQKLSEYYIKQSIEPQKQTVDAMSAKVDSFSNALKAQEQRLASFQDKTKSTLMRTSKIYERRLERDVNVLTAAYMQTVQNLEVASFNLENQRPVFQIIDQSILPLIPERPRLLRTIASATMSAFGIALVCIILVLILRDISNEAEEVHL